MTGTQIRWASVGRVAAVAAAVIAGIAVVPAILGDDRPPPVPADVGVVTPASVSPPAPVAAPTPAAPQPGGAPADHRPGRSAGGKHEARHHHYASRGRHSARQRAGTGVRHRHGLGGDSGSAAAVEPVSPSYAPGPSYSLPSSSAEFRFER